MKFKILESVFDSWKSSTHNSFIYLNPTTAELRSEGDSKDNRGIISPDGNLYMEAVWSEEGEMYSQLIHRDLIELLHQKNLFIKLNTSNWFKTQSMVKYGLCVQRDGDTLDFYVAESYHPELIDNPEVVKQMERMMKRAKEKNPYLNFIPKPIFWAEK